MHHTRSKLRQRAHLVLIYSLMVVTIVALVAILILLAQGYRFNRYDGKIEQGGLVQFDSRPSGATVTLDGSQLANKTGSKLTVSSGAHTVTMTKPGYTTWKKDIVVKPGTVLWLDYVRLYPSNLKTVDIPSYPAIASALVSPDRRQIAATAVTGEASLVLTDLNASEPSARTIVLPSALYTAPAEGQTQGWAVLSWDSDSTAVILKHTYGEGKYEYIAVDTRAANGAYNITARLGVDIADIQYVQGNTKAVYILTSAHELRRGDISASTISGPLLANVAEFSQYSGTTVVYATLPDVKGRSVGYLTYGARQPRAIATRAVSGVDVPMHIAMNDYFGQRYTVVTRGDETTIYQGNLPASDSTDDLDLTPVTVVASVGGAVRIGFSPHDHRYVFVEQGTRYATYDLELDILASMTLSSPVPRGIDWVDEDHMSAVTSSVLTYYDRDTTNAQVIGRTSADLSSAISENGNYLYYFKTVASGATLTRITLTSN